MDARPDNEATTKNANIKVYMIVREEKISYDYFVPARSLKEALEIMDGSGHDEYSFKDYDSHQHVQYYAPRSAKRQWTLEEFEDSYYHTENGTDIDHLEVA